MRGLVVILCLTVAACAPTGASEVRITLTETRGWCTGCDDFEVELTSGGRAVLRALSPCTLPGRHEYQVPAAEVEMTVRVPLDAGATVTWRTARAGPVIPPAVVGLLAERVAVDAARHDGEVVADPAAEVASLAAAMGALDVLERLRQRGVDLSRAGRNGRTPLDLADDRCHRDVVALLQRTGAGPPPGRSAPCHTK